jgi:hypothetical protein
MLDFIIALVASLGAACGSALVSRSRFVFTTSFLGVQIVIGICWYLHVVTSFPSIAHELPFSALPIFFGWLLFLFIPSVGVYCICLLVRSRRMKRQYRQEPESPTTSLHSL